MKRYCTDCGTLLIGRSDKKFCDDYCRTHYNNQLHKEENIALREINKILKKNKFILEKSHVEGQINLTRDSLLAAGFNFNYFTHQKYGKKGETFTFCYEYGYHNLEGGEIQILN